MKIKPILLFTLPLILTGCITTAYQKEGATGGYRENRIGDEVYYIESKVNANTPPQKALEYWHRRATELCGHNQYKAEVTESFNINVNYGVVTTRHRWPVAKGKVFCKELTDKN